ncbi:hypothetical protein OG507_05895 [Streptomyces sp. NBC_01217]|nr:hypothetical protein OG507_05895 [Streptomyces sp. NBC_01217]
MSVESPGGSRELGRQECLRLLAKVPVGRIGNRRRALPAFEADQVDGARPQLVTVRGLVGGRTLYGVDFTA